VSFFRTTISTKPAVFSDDHESMTEMKTKIAFFIKQMMFVSGETSEPAPETTTMIEGIVQQQVIEMVFALSIPRLWRDC